MTIYLIRHGRTLANERRLYCGSTDLGLSEQGREELNGNHFDISNVRFRTSGMKRANETMELLFPGVPYEQDPRFREVDFGVFEMQSYEELKDRRDYQIWLTGDNERNIPPGGESGAQMTARVLSAYRGLTEDTCLVTHGGVIAAIMASLFPEEGRHRYQWQPQNGHGYRITEEGWEPI
ncbi:MAG: histidine phosphatase family protein [Oscillospiraceae bacterium]|nr:histidine phosphatase family protein [Oscillospiraceae bacterium]